MIALQRLSVFLILLLSNPGVRARDLGSSQKTEFKRLGFGSGCSGLNTMAAVTRLSPLAR